MSFEQVTPSPFPALSRPQGWMASPTQWMNLGKLWEAWRAAVHGAAKSDTT